METLYPVPEQYSSHLKGKICKICNSWTPSHKPNFSPMVRTRAQSTAAKQRALRFVARVRRRLASDQFSDFVGLLRTLSQSNGDQRHLPWIIQSVRRLLTRHPDLTEDFETFLGPGSRSRPIPERQPETSRWEQMRMVRSPLVFPLAALPSHG